MSGYERMKYSDNNKDAVPRLVLSYMGEYKNTRHVPADREGPVSQTWNCKKCGTWGIPVIESCCPECGESRKSAIQ